MWINCWLSPVLCGQLNLTLLPNEVGSLDILLNFSSYVWPVKSHTVYWLMLVLWLHKLPSVSQVPALHVDEAAEPVPGDIFENVEMAAVMEAGGRVIKKDHWRQLLRGLEACWGGIITMINLKYMMFLSGQFSFYQWWSISPKQILLQNLIQIVCKIPIIFMLLNFCLG